MPLLLCAAVASSLIIARHLCRATASVATLAVRPQMRSGQAMRLPYSGKHGINDKTR